MKRTLTIVYLLLSAVFAWAQEPLVSRSTKSYLITDGNTKETAFLKEKCRQAGLDLGFSVVANRIPTDSKLVAPKPSEHLLKQGVLHLQLPMDEKQTEFAVYHSELFDQPATINVLQIDDELITYRTTEQSGNIHLFYNCVRGAFGTKKSAHAKNAIVYKLWDTPERTLLPDPELQDQMAQAEAKRLAQTDYPLLIFNDLKSYAYNEQGDLSIGRFLDTMHKYNPEKLLQADLLTPASWPYLSRVNKNQLWNASMRTKIVETLTEKQDFYRKTRMPWMIGNFQIRLADKNHKATTMEELEWFLSKAAAFDAGFGLDCSAETLENHGLADAMLNTINHWETLRLSDAFSEEQKEAFKDPYGNWHLMKTNDSTYCLFEQLTSRQYTCEPSIYHCDTCSSWGSMHGVWNWNSPYNSPLSIVVKVEGAGSISDLCLIHQWGRLEIPCTVEAGQYLIYDGKALITDLNYNTIEEVKPSGKVRLMEGENPVSFTCSFVGEKEKTPHVMVRYLTTSSPQMVILPLKKHH